MNLLISHSHKGWFECLDIMWVGGGETNANYGLAQTHLMHTIRLPRNRGFGNIQNLKDKEQI